MEDKEIKMLREEIKVLKQFVGMQTQTMKLLLIEIQGIRRIINGKFK